MSISQREIARRAVRLRAAIDRNVTNLNLGGCGLFALLAAKALRQLGVEQVEVALPNQRDDWTARDLSPRQCLETGTEPHEMERGHIGVRYILGGKTYCMDSTRIRLGATQFGRRQHGVSDRVSRQLRRNGAAQVSISYPFGQGLTPEEFEPCVKRASAWNHAFDRKQTKKVAALVQAYLVHGVV